MCSTGRCLHSRAESSNAIRILLLTSVFLLIHSLSFGMGLSFGDGTTVSTPTLTAAYLTSIATEHGEPARIAIDNTGFLYASVPESGLVLKFSPDGSQVGAIRGFLEPLGVAVNNQNRVYVGDIKDGSVKVIDPDGGILFSLGTGRGEFGIPGDIAIASDGTVYVSDSSNDVVKVYDPVGTFRFSFGGSGSSAGQMIFPTGVAVDDGNQEIYVVDHSNGRVVVFDFSGVAIRSFSGFGGGDGQLTRPQGIAVSKGRVFVADAFQSSVVVFDRNGTYLGRIGQYGNDAGYLRIPKDLAMSGGKLFVSNAGNRRVEVFSISDPPGLHVDPSSVAFTQEIAVTPASHVVSLTPQVSGVSIPWTATVSAPFPVLLSQASGTAPSAVTVTAEAGNLAPGTYSGAVNFRANDTDHPVSVSMTVVPRASVSPSSLSMLYQVGGNLTTKSLAVTSTGTLPWTAAVNVPWLTLSPMAGSTPGIISVAMNHGIKHLAQGTYTAAVTISASGSAGTLLVVPVSVKVAKAGTIIVSMNIDPAFASLSGAGSYAVSGKTLWQTDEAKPGTYFIQYRPVKGYRKPVSGTFTLRTGQKVVLDGWYRAFATANVIAAAKGPGPDNDAFVQLLDLTGAPLASFKAFDAFYGARVAMGDLDGDGSDEIVAAPGPGPQNAARIAVFRSDGSPLASTQSLTGTRYGAHVAVGDVDGRGKSVIAMSTVDISHGGNSIVLYGLNDGHVLVEKARIEGSDDSCRYPASVAFGDVNHDGRFELIVVRSGRIEIYGFNEAFAPSLLAAGTIPLDAAKSDHDKTQLTVAAGDLDGDETDEIIVGYEKHQDSFIGIFKVNVTASGLTLEACEKRKSDEIIAGHEDHRDSSMREFEDDLLDPGRAFMAFEKRKSAPALSARDWNGDGTAEILAGQGAHPNNPEVVRIYGPGGDLLREIRVPGTSRYGVAAAFGTVKK